MGFFDKIKQSLTRTKEQFVERFDEIVRRADEPAKRSRDVDVETVDALEEALISADVGVAATDQIVKAVRDRRRSGESLRALVKAEILAILQGAEKPMVTGTPQVVMLLAGTTANGPLRVALATTHLPLSSVPQALSRTGLGAVLDVLQRDLVQRFGIARPRIAVCGLNPHAGEGGHLGHEDAEIIVPAIRDAQARGIAASGPFPADTIFVPARASAFDAILAMYHDQGLAPLKYATFGRGVNITLGLPFVRTSVDHGTALDIAGKGAADANSLREALVVAIELAARGAAAPAA